MQSWFLLGLPRYVHLHIIIFLSEKTLILDFEACNPRLKITLFCRINFCEVISRIFWQLLWNIIIIITFFFLGPWEPHGSSWYNCNRYDEDEAKNAREGQEKSRSALQRYLFYCNRYMNHLQSLKFENKLYTMVKVFLVLIFKGVIDFALFFHF